MLDVFDAEALEEQPNANAEDVMNHSSRVGLSKVALTPDASVPSGRASDTQT